jgi:hypothetical protein
MNGLSLLSCLAQPHDVSTYTPIHISTFQNNTTLSISGKQIFINFSIPLGTRAIYSSWILIHKHATFLRFKKAEEVVLGQVTSSFASIRRLKSKLARDPALYLIDLVGGLYPTFSTGDLRVGPCSYFRSELGSYSRAQPP